MLYVDREVALAKAADTQGRRLVPKCCSHAIVLGYEQCNGSMVLPCAIGVSEPAAKILSADSERQVFRELTVEMIAGLPVIMAVDEEDADEYGAFLLLSSAYQYHEVDRHCNSGHVLSNDHLYAAGDGLLAMGIGHGWAVGGNVFTYDVVLVELLHPGDVFYVACGGTGQKRGTADDYMVFSGMGTFQRQPASGMGLKQAMGEDPIRDRFGKLDLLACGFRRVQPAIAD